MRQKFLKNCLLLPRLSYKIPKNENKKVANRDLEPYVIYFLFKFQLIMTIFEGGDRFWMFFNKIGFPQSFLKMWKFALVYLHKIAKNNYFPNFGFIVVFYRWTSTMTQISAKKDYLWPRNIYFSSFLRTLVTRSPILPYINLSNIYYTAHTDIDISKIFP